MIDTEKITSLTQLLDWLANNPLEHYNKITLDMDLDSEEFRPYMSWRADRYTRNCIVRTTRYELLLLCWEKGQASSIHCHDGEECWVYDLQGQLTETRYTLDGGTPIPISINNLKKGELSYMSDAIGHHKLENTGDSRALTLHLYMLPIDECSSWDEGDQQFHRVSLKYDTE